MGVRLPSAYQEVEYLQSVATNGSFQYINTGIIPNPNMRCVMEGRTAAGTSTASFLFGSRVSATSKRFWGIVWQGYYKFGFGNSGNTNITSATLNEDFVFDFNYNANHNMSVNGSAYTVAITVGDTYSLPIWVFTVNNNEAVDTSQTHPVIVRKFTIYSSYEDTDPAMCLIPCYRKSDNEPGMYDLVSDTFFTNAEFVVGGDVIDSISPWLVARRRLLMYKVPELYPVGTEILREYIGSDGRFVDFTADHSISYTDGTYQEDSGFYASDVYVPISAKYTYEKSGSRITGRGVAFYDSDKNFISGYFRNNLNVEVISIPENAAFLRVGTNQSNRALAITRIA